MTKELKAELKRAAKANKKWPCPDARRAKELADYIKEIKKG